MNILPHKSWHVRTKKNIARVRKDEAQAAEEEKERQRKISLAAQEARTAVLRDRASHRLASAAASAPINPDTEVTIRLAPVTDIVQKDGHVNFFQDVEDGKRQGGTNEEAESEKQKEQDDYEKKIGYLVYLGQGSEESSKDKPWYANIDRKKASGDDFHKIKTFENSGYLEGISSKNSKLTPEELKLAKFKSFQDPLKDIRKYLKSPGIVQKMEVSTNKSLKRKTSDEIVPSTLTSKSKKIKKEKKKKSKKSKKRKSHHSHKSKKLKKHRSSSPSTSASSTADEDSEDERKRLNLEKLRAERLEREREERRRTEQLLARLRGETLTEENEITEIGNDRVAKRTYSNPEAIGNGRVKQKYNSQFNPELARQNYDLQ